ncbi:hypothetical protein GCM10009127_09930 [Alteraurantiacibacter aestuarii]|uniref:Uncharacterized protein n=1 Tax=Alteraurantiacibacter aestuarii TaxID=650004 RepID=A0A844ZFT1_9SPHN|nr:hypothetical protein [Alteraurantiacibacter aestuarii]MXO87381.1 hypothetical protein [Alteraurantiacibacter aestuarii]
MKTTRRNMLLGALAVPTVAGLARWRWQYGAHSGLVHDPSLDAGQRFAAAGRAAGTSSRAIEGDTIRFAQELVASRPALIAGVSRHADALMIGEVALEAGYTLAAEIRGQSEGCECFTHDSAWLPLARMAVGARHDWAERFAGWAARPDGTAEAMSIAARRQPDRELALGWLLVPRG